VMNLPDLKVHLVEKAMAVVVKTKFQQVDKRIWNRSLTQVRNFQTDYSLDSNVI
jgi:hypothetical protein